MWLPMSTIHSENDVYFALIRAFPLLPIESDAELDRAVTMINSLLDKPVLSYSEQGYLDILSDLVERYESTHYPLPPVSDGDMLRHLMEAKTVTEAEVSHTSGIAMSAVSGALDGSHQLSRAQIAKLADYFRVDPTVFASWQPEA